MVSQLNRQSDRLDEKLRAMLGALALPAVALDGAVGALGSSWNSVLEAGTDCRELLSQFGQRQAPLIGLIDIEAKAREHVGDRVIVELNEGLRSKEDLGQLLLGDRHGVVRIASSPESTG